VFGDACAHERRKLVAVHRDEILEGGKRRAKIVCSPAVVEIGIEPPKRMIRASQ